MCSTGAAMKETVKPAMTPAIAWPRVGSFDGGVVSRVGDNERWDGEKRVRWSRER